MRGILDFYDIVSSTGFDIPAQEAIDLFQAKGLKPSFAWQDVMRDEHQAAFTVAKMMDVDMLGDVHNSLIEALASGTSYNDWADNLIPFLQQRGWWGRQAVLDPLTGQTVIAQLGSPARLQTIFRTNMQSAYAAGQWDQIEAQAEYAPYLMYDAIDDYRTRPEHKAWDGIVRPVTDTFWKFHTPPCGWNCRCSVIQLDQDDIQQLGMEVSKPPATKYEEWTNPRTGKSIKVPQGVDPGFGHAASSRIDNLKKLLNEKVAVLPDPMEQAAKKAVAEMDKALAEKTPYLSTAIKNIKAKNPELAPVQLLNEAKAKAAKAKVSASLTHYKDAIIGGKKPSASQQAAFDALPQEAQLALLKDIEQKTALLKANAAATAKLDEFKAATPTSAQGKALIALQKAGQLDGVSVIEQAAKLEAKLIEVKAIANTSSMLSNYKKAVLGGKIPSAQQKAAFDSLPDDQKQAFLAKIDKEKAKLAPPPVPAGPPRQ
jgi:SPP1 gp7 family putative phage head morphogenesis protein